MNKQRREQLRDITERLESVQADIEELAEEEQEAADAIAENFDGTERHQKAEESADALNEAVRRQRFEEYLRDEEWPYVAVSEAKKAIFAGDQRGHFDFLVYSTNGPNLLVDVLADGRSSTPAQRADLADWGQIFGENFAPCLVRFERGGWAGITLKEYEQVGWHPQGFDLLM